MNTDDRKKLLKKAIVVRYRREKGLCLRCGKTSNDQCVSEKCIENYDKVNNNEDCEDASKNLNTERKMKTVIAYRKKKNLCKRCGRDPNNDICRTEMCPEVYDRSDNRDIEERQIKPSTIITPKKKGVTILQKIESSTPTIQAKKTDDVNLQRNFIILDISDSKKGNKVEFSCLNQLTKKYKNYIICILGNLEKKFPYSDMAKIKRMTNIFELKCHDQQTIINYLWSCKKFFSFESDFTQYCISNSISVYVFPEDKNATNFLNNSAFDIL
jgi:hypothetical protein